MWRFLWYVSPSNLGRYSKCIGVVMSQPALIPPGADQSLQNSDETENPPTTMLETAADSSCYLYSPRGAHGQIRAELMRVQRYLAYDEKQSVSRILVRNLRSALREFLRLSAGVGGASSSTPDTARTMRSGEYDERRKARQAKRAQDYSRIHK